MLSVFKMVPLFRKGNMMKWFLSVPLVAVLLCAVTFAEPPTEHPTASLFGIPLSINPSPTASVPDYLQAISVTIKAGGAQGSGTLVTRTIGKDTVSFIWTAGHVVADLRTIRKVINKDGQTRVLVEFKDPQIVQERQQSGRRVGEVKYDCRVIKYSDADYGEDLCLLQVRCLNAYPASISAKFQSDIDYVPPIGAELSHCGSLLGQFGANSYTEGVLSQVGRTLPMAGANVKVFDQVTTVAFPGSSGGGMFLKDSGEYVGMLTMGVTQMQGFNFIVPVRRIHAWSKTAGVEWAINPAIQVPSLAELNAIPVEDVGVFSEGPTGYRTSVDETDGPVFLPSE